MKFTREDTPTIMDGMAVSYKHSEYFEINASRKGVSINGFMPRINELEDIGIVCDYLRRAWLHHIQLRSGGRNPLSEEQIDKMVFGERETRSIK